MASGKRLHFPRIIICAPGSGSGKTLITCALLRILDKKGMEPAAFKCGPDYIDPMFHRNVLGIPSRNLDLFLAGKDGLVRSLRKGSEGRQIGIIEGVMGYYDGMGASSMEGSSYDIAGITGTKAVLVVNAKGMSRSVIPVIKGCAQYRDDSGISGVILNNVSPMIASELSELIEKELGIPILGFLPPMKEAKLESRHLGLVLPEEVPDLLDMLDKVAQELEKNLDFGKLIGIAEASEDLDIREVESIDGGSEDVGMGYDDGGKAGVDAIKVGVARDEAFCFYYEDNLELLQELGAELVFFSPIHDKKLPDVDRLLFGGGYPELYAGEISENKAMLEDIRKAAKSGMPILAECGGFLYLQQTLETGDHARYSMAGIFPGESHMTDKLSHFGYVSVTANSENPYLYFGESIRGHEFHYYDTTANGDICTMTKPGGKRSWMGYQSKGSVFGGFAHLYYPSCISFVRRFLAGRGL